MLLRSASKWWPPQQPACDNPAPMLPISKQCFLTRRKPPNLSPRSKPHALARLTQPCTQRGPRACRARPWGRARFAPVTLEPLRAGQHGDPPPESVQKKFKTCWSSGKFTAGPANLIFGNNTGKEKARGHVPRGTWQRPPRAQAQDRNGASARCLPPACLSHSRSCRFPPSRGTACRASASG